MFYIICLLFPVLIGALLGGTALWLLNRSIDEVIDEPPEMTSRAGEPIGILWMTKTCNDRLGKCAPPHILRRIEPDRIARLLAQGVFPPGEVPPTVNQYSSWPEQAELIAAGKYDQLTRLQKKLLSTHEIPSDPDLQSQAIDGPQEREATAKDRSSLIVLALLALLSIPAFILMKKNNCFNGCYVLTPPPNITITDMGNKKIVTANTDQFFDYNSGTLAEQHLMAAEHTFEAAFKQFDNVTITRIDGYTDPIGGLCFNRRLSTERANSIASLLNNLANDQLKIGVDQNGRAVKGTGSGPGIEEKDRQEWARCSLQHQVGIAEPKYRPLKAIENPKTCSNLDARQVSAYPENLIPVELKKIRDPSVAAQIAANQMNMISCLTNMRRVTIEFTGTRKPQANTAITASENGTGL